MIENELKKTFIREKQEVVYRIQRLELQKDHLGWLLSGYGAFSLGTLTGVVITQAYQPVVVPFLAVSTLVGGMAISHYMTEYRNVHLRLKRTKRWQKILNEHPFSEAGEQSILSFYQNLMQKEEKKHGIVSVSANDGMFQRKKTMRKIKWLDANGEKGIS